MWTLGCTKILSVVAKTTTTKNTSLSCSSFPTPSLNYTYIFGISNVDIENISWFIQKDDSFINYKWR